MQLGFPSFLRENENLFLLAAMNSEKSCNREGTSASKDLIVLQDECNYNATQG